VDTNGIDLLVIDVLRGTESRDTIRIWDGTDFDCNGIFSMAAADLGKVNDSIVLVLPQIDSMQNSWDVLGDYRRPDYYTYIPSLKWSNGILNGLAIGMTGDMPSNQLLKVKYSDFKDQWKKNNGCLGLTSMKEGLSTQEFVRYQNPISSTLNLTFNSVSENAINIQIFNSHGALIISQSIIETEVDIDFTVYNSGIYVVRLYQNNRPAETFRIIKE
tara:strand:- start:398 stop:1045 length:648 start_codon:yes stop_codon:yes gene_type:complete